MRSRGTRLSLEHMKVSKMDAYRYVLLIEVRRDGAISQGTSGEQQKYTHLLKYDNAA